MKKLLIITQKVDTEDPILGFFHNWILELSKKFENISVICLEKGSFNLPPNVKVFSLGKESNRSKIKYLKNFINLILGLNREYDYVFVHMNQEYVLLGGLFWKIIGKKVFMWRNHSYGNLFTRISVLLSDKVFCTSRFAFVAKYKKTILMPVGIDTNKFMKFENSEAHKVKNSILFLGRMSPIKRPDLLLEALIILDKKDVSFQADFYGGPLLKDQGYYDSIKANAKGLMLKNKLSFYNGVPNYDTPKIYNEHDIFINLTPSGSFDKTILEAAACGCLLVTTNKSLFGDIDDKMIVESPTPENLAESINFWINTNNEERKEALDKLQKYVLEKHNLDALVNKLYKEIIQ